MALTDTGSTAPSGLDATAVSDTPSAVLLTCEDGLVRVTLNRPATGNAINPELVRTLRETLEQVTARDDIRAALLCAEGSAFCVGGDIDYLAGQDEGSDALRSIVLELHEAISAIASLPVPTIAVVQGVAAGAGMSLALAADVVLAGESARFTTAYAKVGLTPDGGASWHLPRIVGAKRALELFLRSPLLTAREALELGIVTATYPDDDLIRESARYAAALAGGPTLSYQGMKRLVYGAMEATLDEQLAAEADLLTASGASQDGVEGLSAFANKRTPNFGGR